jgi:hypothetical protein
MLGEDIGVPKASKTNKWVWEKAGCTQQQNW